MSVWNVDTNIAKGVSLTVEDSYSALNQVPIEDDLAIGGTAIEVRAGTTLNTQADIILNAKDAIGIQSYDDTTRVNASNHSISMNAPRMLALSLVDNGTMNIDNVKIQGNADHQLAVDIAAENAKIAG